MDESAQDQKFRFHDFGLQEFQEMMPEIVKAARQKAAEENADPNKLVTLDEARTLAMPVVTSFSQEQAQMARLFHYVILSDTEGTLATVLTWNKGQPVPQVVAKRYELIKGFCERFPLDGSGELEIESFLREVVEAIYPVDLAQFALLASNAVNLLKAWDHEDFLFGYPEDCVLSPDQVARVLKYRHGPSYSVPELLLSGDDGEPDQLDEALEFDHQKLVLEINEALGMQQITLSMHPVAYLNHLDILNQTIQSLILDQKRVTKKLLGVSRGKPRYDLSVTDEAKLHIRYLRMKFGVGSKSQCKSSDIENRLLKKLTDDDIGREISKLDAEFEHLKWSQAFINARHGTFGMGEVFSFYEVASIPLETWILAAQRLHDTIVHD